MTLRDPAGVAMSRIVVDEHADDVLRVTREQATAVIRSPQFANQVRDLVRSAALECAREVLAEVLPDLEVRVRAIVMENFDRSVGAAAHGILDDKLADIRRRLT